MILSRGNLQAVIVAKDDKGVPALDNVHVVSDGSTVGASSQTVIAVSPVNPSLKEDVILRETELDKSLTIPISVISKVLKSMPKDTLFNGLREHCDVSSEGNKVYFEIKDGKGTETKDGMLYRHNYIKYKDMFKRIMTYSRKSVKMVLNIKRMRSLLEAVDKICPDSTNENAVFIEFTEDNDMIMRAVNKATQQRVVAAMFGYTGIEGKWLKENKWEKSLTEGNRIKKKERKK